LDNIDGTIYDFSLIAFDYAGFMKTTFDCYYADFMSGNYVSIRNFDNYIKMISGNQPESCAMGGVCTCYLTIEGDGSVFPCDFYVLDEWAMGNINSDSIPKIIQSKNAQNFVNVSKHRAVECNICKWYSLCRGGCRRDREPVLDDKPALNKYCAAYKDFFSYAYDRMIKIAEKLRKDSI